MVPFVAVWSLPAFHNLSPFLTQWLPIEYHGHNWQASLQLSCSDTRQIWNNLRFFFLFMQNQENNKQGFSNPIHRSLYVACHCVKLVTNGNTHLFPLKNTYRGGYWMNNRQCSSWEKRAIPTVCETAGIWSGGGELAATARKQTRILHVLRFGTNLSVIKLPIIPFLGSYMTIKRGS